MTVFTRFRRIAGALAVVALSVTACSGGGPGSGGGGEPQRGGDVIFLESGAFTSFAQQDLRLWQNSSVSVNLFDLLVYLDPETGELEPWLASEWEHNPDYTEFLLTLREGVTFSDGSPLTSAVVVANLDRFGFGDPARGYTPSRPQFVNYERAEPVGANQVRIHLKQTDTGFLNGLSDLRHSIVAQKTLDLPYEQAADIRNAIGSGPFVLDSVKADTEIRIVRRSGYAWPPASVGHTGEAYLDSVTYIVSSEGSSRTGLLLSGQAHLARDVQITDEKQLQSKGFHYYGARPFGAIRELSINPSANELIADLRVRQAIQHGIDIDEIISAVYNDNWAKAAGLVQRGTPGHREITGEYDFDADRANRLLDEAGWTARGADGIRTKDGKRLAFTLYPEPNWVAAVQDAELIAIQLQRIGIGIDLVKLDRTTYTAVTTKPENVFVWSHQTGADVSQLWARYRSGGVGGNTDPAIDALLARINTLPVGAERTAAVDDVQRWLLDNALVVPLQETQQSFVTAPNLYGFRAETLGRSYLYDAWLAD
ncbi:ABC transporter substrate-binding protein [Nocardia higoensis]|uniref:ABC transporter substrate-binding protein n=1 Tax=Nocardia higoensis TaxID=228599 RepID=UPI0003097435|nr:ABC transporter substrate-binding protein [Nocardia higoensis]